MKSLIDLVAPASCERSSSSALVRLLTGATCLALLTACPPKDDGDDSSASETDPSSADTTVGDEPSTSPTEATEPSTSDSETDGDTEGVEPPIECGAPDPAVSAAFSIEGAWANDDEKVTPCTVDAVSVEADTIVTSLSCDDGGEPLAVTVNVAAAAEGSPAWKAGDAVDLRAWNLSEPGFDFEYGLIEMRLSADDSLLILALRGEIWKPELASPIVLGAAFPCGPEEDFAEGQILPFQLEFELAGATLGLIEGHRGALAIDGSQTFAIDVAEANTNNCCHYTRWHHFVIRRVTL